MPVGIKGMTHKKKCGCAWYITGPIKMKDVGLGRAEMRAVYTW